MALDFFMPLLTFPDPTDKDALLRALDLAARLGGRVTVQAGEVDIRNIRSFLGEALLDLSAMIADAEAKSRARATELLGVAEAAAAGLQLPLVSQRLRGAPELLPDMVAAAARTSDYTILAECGTEAQIAVAEAVLFGSGGPVLLMPGADMAFHAEVVAVAWDGSRAAARAVRDALPIIGGAKKVIILTVDDDKPLDSVRNDLLAEHLRYRGVVCEFARVGRGTLDIGDRLQQASLSAGAGLLVMGAYGHNRITEWVLGGATRGVVSRRQMTVLMSH